MFKLTLLASILSHLLHLGQMTHGGLSFITEASMGHSDLTTEDHLFQVLYSDSFFIAILFMCFQRQKFALQSQPTLPSLHCPLPHMWTEWAQILPLARIHSVPSPLLIKWSSSPKEKFPSLSHHSWPQPTHTSCWAFIIRFLKKRRMQPTGHPGWRRDLGNSLQLENVKGDSDGPF